MSKIVMKATVTLKKNIQVEVKSRNHSFILDQPKADDEGMTPVEALLGALGACKTMMVRAYSRSRDMNIKSVVVEMEGDLYEGKGNDFDGFSEIRTRYIIESDASDEELQDFIEYVDVHCPVAASLREKPPMISTIERR